MSPKDFAYLMGAVITLVAVITFFIILMTDDFGPVERRARRFAFLAGVMAATAVIGAEVAIYFLVNEVAGAFLAIPSLALMAVAAWLAAWAAYRRLGGGQENAGSSPASA